MTFALSLLLLLCVTAGSFRVAKKRLDGDQTKSAANLKLGQGPRRSKPNVILFVMDDLGWADVSYHTSGGNFPTPHMDRLSREGVRLERFYVQPQCSPTRSTIITGRHSWKMGLAHYNTIVPGGNAGIPDGTRTLADHFREGGYQTHAIGKWHLGESSREQLPTGKGFDTFVGSMTGRIEFYNRTLATCGDPVCLFANNADRESPYGPNGAAVDLWEFKDADTFRPLPPSMPPTAADYAEDVYEKRAMEVIDQAASRRSKPFFMYFSPNLIHEPLEAPPQPYPRCRRVLPSNPVDVGFEPLNRTALCTMTMRLDDHFSAIENKLIETGLWNDTLIFALTDNGGMIQYGNIFPASVSCNWPLRGSKSSLFEGGVRVTAFVTGGALPQEARGTEVHNFMYASDIFATLATFAGLPAPPADTDGVDQWRTIIGQEGRRQKDYGREVMPFVNVNPIGGMPAFAPGFTDEDAPADSLNFSAIYVWPRKLIFAEAYVILPGGPEGEPLPRSGYYSCDADGYVYHQQKAGSELIHLDIPDDSSKYPRTHGRTMKAWLFDVEQDPYEENNLLQEDADGEWRSMALSMAARIESLTQPANGWVKDQSNMISQASNPACYNWTRQPGPWKTRTCLRQGILPGLPR